MILNTTDSALLKTSLESDKFYQWLKNDTAAVSNTAYSDIRNKFIDWAAAYAAGDLYVTTGQGTVKLEGIDSITPPPAR